MGLAAPCRRIFAPALILAIALLAASPSHALFFTSEAAFAAANPGLPTLDFEGLAPPGGFVLVAPNQFAGITLGPAVPGQSINDAAWTSAHHFAAPSDWLCSCDWDVALTIDFTSPVDAVGLIVASFERNNPGSAGGNVTVNVFDGVTLLDSRSFFATNVDSLDTFAGFSGFGTGITRVEIIPDDPDNAIAIDDLSFGADPVPEPGMALLLGTGLLALAVAARRQSR